MVDTNALLRALLLAQTPITNLVGTSGVFAGDLPEHFNPANGPCIQIRTMSSPPAHSEILPMVDERKLIKVWADVEQYQLARQVYGVVRDFLHGLCGASHSFGTVVRSLEVTPGQDLSDPDTGWATVVSFYLIMAHS